MFGHIVLVLAAGVLAVGWYAVSLTWHPYVPCKTCEGSGREYDPIFPKAFGDCQACDGKGKLPRLGVRIFQAARAAELVKHRGPLQRNALRGALGKKRKS